MVTGHAALALLAKSARPRVPIVVLGFATFAPDIVQGALRLVHRSNTELSHSLVSVGIGSTVLAFGYWLFTRASGADALAVWLTYVSHWPADFITGVKPTWPGGPFGGLVFYATPIRDAVVECDLILACWVIYWYSLPYTQRTRRLTLAIPWVLIAVQLGFDFSLTRGTFGM